MITNLSVEVIDEPGVVVALVSGLFDERGRGVGAVPMLVDGGRVRALAPSRSPHARRPGKPLEPGLPSLAQILRQFSE